MKKNNNKKQSHNDTVQLNCQDNFIFFILHPILFDATKTVATIPKIKFVSL